MGKRSEALQAVSVTWDRKVELAEVDSEDRVAILRLGLLNKPPVILEGSAAVVWRLINRRVTHIQLTADVSAEFGVEASDIEAAVGDFLEDLTAQSLLDRSTEGAALVAALGLAIQIDVSGSSGDVLVEEIRKAWAQCLLAGQGIDPSASVSIALDDPADLRRTLEFATQQVTNEAIKCRAGTHLMFHACAVAHPTTGQSVVMVGPSGMGKTTLAADLGRSWAYVTDETAAVAQDRSLVPYPKPLSVITDGHGKEQVAPESLGLIAAPTGLQVAAVVLLNRRGRNTLTEETGLVIESVSTVKAIAMLGAHTSYLSRLDRPLHRIADLLNATGGLRIAHYTATSDLEPLITELIGPGAAGRDK